MASNCIDHGRKSKVGYACSGSARAKGEEAFLHRRIFKEIHGYSPPVVMHTCDNPRCINPDHLVAGDWDKNNKDRAAKGRSAKFRKDLRKLSLSDAKKIRERWALRNGYHDKNNGVTALSRDFGIDTTAVYNIVRGKTYLD